MFCQEKSNGFSTINYSKLTSQSSNDFSPIPQSRNPIIRSKKLFLYRVTWPSWKPRLYSCTHTHWKIHTIFGGSNGWCSECKWLTFHISLTSQIICVKESFQKKRLGKTMNLEESPDLRTTDSWRSCNCLRCGTPHVAAELDGRLLLLRGWMLVSAGKFWRYVCSVQNFQRASGFTGYTIIYKIFDCFLVHISFSPSRYVGKQDVFFKHISINESINQSINPSIHLSISTPTIWYRNNIAPA